MKRKRAYCTWCERHKPCLKKVAHNASGEPVEVFTCAKCEKKHHTTEAKRIDASIPNDSAELAF